MAIMQETETKGIHIWKETVKLPLSSYDMILHVENPKEYTNTDTHY